ncbi:MAG: MgtC/SapB family protein [Acidobacteriota bacterium]
MNDLFLIFEKMGIALGLGLLVGLQRESADSRLAGVRTFPLVTVLGTVCALLAETFGGWVVGLGLAGLAALTIMANLIEVHEGRADAGMTTEVAVLLMFAVGAYIVPGRTEVAIAVGGGVAVLLHLKRGLHGFVARLGQEDLRAIMRFVLISLVVLPILPNRTYGPYSVLNPYQIWLMVVLIVGISLGGYIAYRFLGAKAGMLLGGILGGLISSTATTASYARASVNTLEASSSAASVIMMASAFVFVRVLLEIAVVAPAFLSSAVGPVSVMFGVIAGLALSSWLWNRKETYEMPAHENPSELKPALMFGLLFAGVLLTVAAAKELFGNQGLYVVAALSGLTDMDAITLSTAQLVNAGRMAPGSGWQLILVASLSNLIFKAGIAGVLGTRRLLRQILPMYGLAFLAGVLVLILWPILAA